MNIEIKDLFFKYSKHDDYILKGINLAIKENSVNIILGLNGSGKTTLLRQLAGLEIADKGYIYYENNDINSLSYQKRSKIFSYVPQHISIKGDIEIREYLSFGTVNSLTFYESPKRKQFDLIESIAKELNICHLLHKKIGEISGGEKQLVLIASALIQNTPVIILDEPTSALDIKNQHLVLSILKNEAIKRNKTIILTSHNPNHALFLNANVIMINGGQIENVGLASEMINPKQLFNIYGDSICLSKELKYDEISFK